MSRAVESSLSSVVATPSRASEVNMVALVRCSCSITIWAPLDTSSDTLQKNNQIKTIIIKF